MNCIKKRSFKIIVIFIIIILLFVLGTNVYAMNLKDLDKMMLNMKDEEFFEELILNKIMFNSKPEVLASSLILVFIIIGIIFIITAILSLIRLIAKWQMYKKANKPGWATLLPVYKDVILFEVAGIPPVLILIPYFGIFVPILGQISYVGIYFVFRIIISINIAKVFDRSRAFAVGLFFFPTIFYSILGFGKAKYVGIKEKSEEKVVVTKEIETKVKQIEAPKDIKAKKEETKVKKETIKAKQDKKTDKQ